MASIPPAYETGFADFSTSPQPLPRYTRTVPEWNVPAADRHHEFHLTKKTGERWLTFTVISRAATVADTPTFFQGGAVSGTLKLQLHTEELVDGITITLYGKLSIFSHSTSDFLCMSRSIYSANHTHVERSSVARRGKLQGHYEWPYSFRLPKGVSIMSTITTDARGERKSYRLPPSFQEKHSNVGVQYSLVVRVDRGGLRKGSKLVVPFEYIPLARPGPPPILRQLAYREGFPIPGPEFEPEGWKTREGVRLEGTLFKRIHLEALCTLSVARPLTYTRGAPIHLLISIQSDNEQFLDLLTPQSMNVELLQHVTFGDNEPRFSRRLSAQITMKTRSLAAATWWRTDESAAFPGIRTFAGELQVPSDAVPACHILHYGHEYELEFNSLNAVGFTKSASVKKTLLTEAIDIVTAFANGPLPRSHFLPAYIAV